MAWIIRMAINHFSIFVRLKYLKDLPTQLICSVGY